MINLTTGQLETWIAQAFWPFVRIGACLMVAPAFGAVFVPPRLRIGLAAMLALLVAPLVPAPEGITAFSGAGVVVTVQQVLIGVAIGFALQILFDAVSMGGQLLANSMGLSFAFNVDPLRGSSTAALGQLYIVLATLVFLSLGGHLAIVQVLVDGLSSMPIGAELRGESLWAIVLWGGTLFSGAISIALPGVTALLIVNLAFGVMSRAAPALNLFAVGFPISLIIGLVVVLAGMAPLIQGITALIGQGLQFLRDLSGV
jgi:flagellar biosynthesis protein FliR